MSTTSNKEKLHLSIDASSLSHSACILEWKWTVVDGYKGTRPKAAMVYGTAVHKFIDTMFKSGGNIALARDNMLQSFRVPKVPENRSRYLEDELHLIGTCNNLWFFQILEEKSFDLVQLPTGPEGKLEPATEVNFSIPFYEDETVVISISGTIDKIGKFKNGIYAVGDWKTSSISQAQEHVESYELAAQLRMYVLAIKMMGRLFPDSILGKIGLQTVGAFIDGIYIRSRVNENECLRSDVYIFSDKDMTEYEANLRMQCQRLSTAIQIQHFPREGILNGACKKGWGKCSFYNVCKQDNVEYKEMILKRDFLQTPYEPLKFHD